MLYKFPMDISHFGQGLTTLSTLILAQIQRTPTNNTESLFALISEIGTLQQLLFGDVSLPENTGSDRDDQICKMLTQVFCLESLPDRPDLSMIKFLFGLHQIHKNTSVTHVRDFVLSVFTFLERFSVV